MPHTYDQSTPTRACEEPRRAQTRDQNPVDRRQLRRRWNQGLPQPVIRRPGARYYVTIRQGPRVGWLLGPYASHTTALANVERGRQLATNLRPDQTAFAAFGTASHPHTLPTLFGR
jgi:hypothetical protein